jgi:hypothetical protein
VLRTIFPDFLFRICENAMPCGNTLYATNFAFYR